MRFSENHVLFSGRESVLSNFHESPFTAGGRKFSSMEQYLCFKKADLFNDRDISERIMRESDPGKIKQLGKQVKHFDAKVWHNAKSDIGEEGLKCKFDQNPGMKEFLLQQKGKYIGEMTKDKQWGAGIGLHHHNAMDHNKWPGENLLGKLLMKVRDNI